MALEKMPYSIKRYGPDSLSQYYYAVKAMYDEGYGVYIEWMLNTARLMDEAA